MGQSRCFRARAVPCLVLVAILAVMAAPGSVVPHGSRLALGPSSDVPYVGGWVNATPVLSPPALGGGMMAFSASADQFVLFGGSDGEATNATWVLAVGGAGWTELHPAVSPPARADGMFVYDSAAEAFVLFGGWHQDSAGAYLRWDDTWVFYLGNDTWVPRHPEASPSARSDSAIAYDPADDVTFLVGGFNGTAYLGDEWAYTFANDSWWPRSAPSGPSPRADGRMTYDSDTGAFYLYGGNDYSGPNFTYHHLGDTWRYAWSPRHWTRLSPTSTPGALDYAVLAADARWGVLLMSGGYGESVVLGDTWAFNTTRGEWARLVTPVSPPPRMAAVGGYDPVADEFVVFSGGVAVSGKDDTWLLPYPPILLASASASSTQAGVGSSIDFTGQMMGGTGFLASASWSFGDGGTADGTHATHSFAVPGVYWVVFTVTDDRARVTSAGIQVTVGAIGPLGVDLVASGITAAAAVAAVVLLRRRRSRPPRKDGGVEPGRPADGPIGDEPPRRPD